MFSAPKQETLTQSIYDIAEIRRQAGHALEKGAVTQNYPLDLKLAIELLNQALATEVVCILRYRHHQIIAKGIDFPQVSAEFAEHAADEEKHLLLIAERIAQLGGDPDLNPATVTQRSAAEFGSNGSLHTMIREDLVAERVAIEVYRKMIHWFGEGDPTTRRMLEGILAEEEEHANDMADLLACVNSKT